MDLKIFQIDAFAKSVFRGNPAAVVPMMEWLPDEVLQAIAAENNLAETAFIIPSKTPEVEQVDYHIRWFTPVTEVDLCGHATLASAHCLVHHLDIRSDHFRFGSKSGTLETFIEEDKIVLDFPSRPGEQRPVSQTLASILGGHPTEMYVSSRDTMVVFNREEEVRALKPDMAKLAALNTFGFIATAPGAPWSGADFVSRFFAPKVGVPEDPVTGSAHCTLVPYWAERLAKNQLHAVQVSQRMGELFCELRRAGPGTAGERVRMGGHAVTYMEGIIHVDVEAAQRKPMVSEMAAGR